MKRFLFKTLWFCGILLLINYGLLHLVTSIYISDYTHVSFENDSYLLADSHGASLDTLPKRYGVENFSDRSDSYIDLERKLNYLVRHGSPKTIYLTADPHMLSPDREAYNNNMLSAAFTNKTDYDSFYTYVLEAKIKPNTVFFNKKYMPLLKNYAKGLLKKPNTSAPNILWADKEATEKKRLSEERMQVYFSSTHTSAALKAALQRMVALCEQNNIELIGVKFPLSPTYNTMLGDKNFHADGIFRANRMPILDFQDSLQNDLYFRDQDHLNDDGANQFCRLLLAPEFDSK